MNRICALFAIVVLAAGCSPSLKSAAYMADEAYGARPELTESLFKSDREVMSNETIDTILSSRIVVPDKARIVILNFGPQRWRYWWSEEVSRLDQAALDGFIAKVRACDRVADASVLPSMLAPPEQTIPYLRQAAARCQANLVFLYRSTSQVYQKERLLAHDKARSYCLVEAVLLDTRTGIVPFTSAVTKTYTAEKSQDDFNLAETVRKAELKALGEALGEIADELVKFLDSVPPATTKAARSGT